MAMSGVYGLGRFGEYMAGLEEHYAVIGGTACDILLNASDLPFRATKEIDVVLMVEDRPAEVGRAIWKLLSDGGYAVARRGTENAHFYRFSKPAASGFPSMVELFGTEPNFITEPDGLEIVPVPMGEDVSSLSAILLDADYYSFMCGGRKVVDGISVLGEAYLVPFKAKAFLDLRERRACGEHVDSKDLRKHKNDVFRLLQLFTPETTAPLPDSIRDDMSHFCNIMSEEGVPLRQIGVRMALDEALGQIARSYGL